MAKRTRPVPGMVSSDDDDDLDTEVLEVDSRTPKAKVPSKASQISPKRGGLKVPDAPPKRSGLKAPDSPGSKDQFEDRASSKISDASYQVLEEILEEKREEEARTEKLVKTHQEVVEGVRHQVRKVKTKSFDQEELGPCRKFVHNIIDTKSFDTFIGLVIALNGVTIGEETSHNVTLNPLVCDENCNCTMDDVVCKLTPDWVQVMETTFFVIYVLELVARYFVHHKFALRNRWVQFDTLLVLCAIVDMVMRLSGLQDATLKKFMLFRLLRLARLARAVRLMSQFQTLWQLVAGLMFSVKTLLWTFLLLAIMIYMFALFGMEFITFDSDLPVNHPYNVAALENFRGLENAALFLLQCFSWDGIGGVYRPLIQHNIGNFFYFMIILLVNSIALANIVTAIMVEGALEQGNEDKDAQKAWESARRKKQMEHLKVMFLELDEDGSGELCMEEIDIAPDEIREQLVEIAGTDDIKGLFELLDYDGGGTVDTEEFCEGVIRAAAKEKPLELSKLLKQCGEILHNSRTTKAILSGDDQSKEVEGDDATPWDSKGGNDRGKTARQKELSLSGITDRLGDMEKSVADLELDIVDISSTIHKLLHVPSASRANSNRNIKRAVAVCKGPAKSSSPNPSRKSPG